MCYHSCKKNDKEEQPAPQEPQLIFKFKFDPTQERLDNFGNTSTIPSGNAAQSPTFHAIGANYIELAPNANTALGNGFKVYNGPSTTEGGAQAIDFDKEKNVAEGEVFYSMPIKNATPGNYKWLRVSLAYQNYDVKFRVSSLDLTGRLASFVGYNTYINSFKVKDSLVTVNDDKLQGYWAFETAYNVIKGQAPQTTVPNPINSTSPIPAGSCVVTGNFEQDLTITGNETKDVVVTISLSTNKSFEWKDDNSNGIWEPTAGELVVDMGLRGLKPSYTK